MKFARIAALALGTALTTALTGALTPTGAQAQAVAGEMTDAEREMFRAEVRAYLLDNPEVLMEAISVLESRDRVAQMEVDAAAARAYADQLQNDGVSWVGGNLEGDVVIVEFMDYRCGYCRQAFAEVEELVATDGNIRLVLKEFPILGEQSVMASRFALSALFVAGDDAYKEVHDSLMSLNADITVPTLARLAEGLDLDAEAILAGMNSAEVTQVLADNAALAEALRITGTPTFVMEDQMLRGYVPLDQMQLLVEGIRAEG